MPESRIRVALVEEVALTRAAVACLLDSWPEIELICSVASREEALFAMRSSSPALIVVSVRLPGTGLSDFLTALRSASPATLVVALGDREDPRAAGDAIRSGCHGYAARDQDDKKLRHVIHEVAEGRLAVTPGVDVPSAFLSPKQVLSPLDSLSLRERQVFTLLAEGAKVRRIGELLGLSPKTVDSYRASLMRKLNLYDFAALMRLALDVERAQTTAASAGSGASSTGRTRGSV